MNIFTFTRWFQIVFQQTLEMTQFKVCIHLYGYEIVSHCRFCLYFSADSGVEHLLKCVLIKSYSFSELFAICIFFFFFFFCVYLNIFWKLILCQLEPLQSPTYL